MNPQAFRTKPATIPNAGRLHLGISGWLQSESAIVDLLRRQGRHCVLMGYDFERPTTNPHLKRSLDRIYPDQGHGLGNFQVVPRAANFHEFASDDADRAMKVRTMAVVIAMRVRETIESDVATNALTPEP